MSDPFFPLDTAAVRFLGCPGNDPAGAGQAKAEGLPDVDVNSVRKSPGAENRIRFETRIE